MLDANDKPCLGRNDATHVYCGECGWFWPIYSFEQAEMLLKRHLKAAHGKTMRYAVEVGSGKVEEAP